MQSTPEEQIDKAFGTIKSALRTELLQRILQNTPTFFEELIIDLLVKMGYGGSRPLLTSGRRPAKRRAVPCGRIEATGGGQGDGSA